MASSYRKLSKRAKELLASGESKVVDYKERVKGLHAEDLVAFSNSAEGGAILLGVREASENSGAQYGEPIGHPIDDDTRLQILGKALSCSPPVQIEIVIENLGANPFYRIEIPSGSNKPYATNGGTYKIREDGRNNPLLPEQLLRMFLEREAEEFNRRFSESTSKLTSDMSRALGSVQDLEHIITAKIEEMGSSLGWAEYKASDAADVIETVQAYVASLIKETRKQTQRLRAVSRKVEADDPVRQSAREETFAYLIEELKKKPDLLARVLKGEPFSISLTGDAAAELSKQEISEVFIEAAKALAKEVKNGSKKGTSMGRLRRTRS